VDIDKMLSSEIKKMKSSFLEKKKGVSIYDIKHEKD